MIHSIKQEKKDYFGFNKKNEKIKLIPKKYKKVAIGFVTESKEPWLTLKERFLMEVQLYKQKLREENVLVWELIKDSEPTKVYKVLVKFNADRYEIQLGKYAVKCPKSLYDFAVQRENKLQLTSVKHSMF